MQVNFESISKLKAKLTENVKLRSNRVDQTFFQIMQKFAEFCGNSELQNGKYKILFGI